MSRKYIFAVFLATILLWIFVAVGRGGVYFLSLILNDLQKGIQGNLPDDQSYFLMKKLALENRFKKVDAVVFTGEEGRDFFLLRYLSYPQRVYWAKESRWTNEANVVFVGDK